MNRKGKSEKQKKINNYFQSFTTIDVQTLPWRSEMTLSELTFDGTKNWQNLILTLIFC